MMAIVNFTILAVATLFAVAAAAALSWICLRIAFVLMQPARAWRATNGTPLVDGTARLARAFSTNR
jgi:hypothetical protein